ncbi:hypothetical protein PF005_g14619 [Phytophthora fragariae]|uniref:RxLR effector protein n=1 Tax=Phytophthora fragariae TaxID=53985 RepID=A0A6A3TF27_9STRA|nr:hypothetical protein PF003_g14792 [Phytophthora fragariae]KAE8934052.1 hypothetical protein PF009_g15960 [Phytophthora fragariae]KAE8973894.1 hypothetical protein PF011_g25074 [Phytophthora fragariae]KAE9100707.1 hypothetical protein PF007_g15398 [Phytophthora fragariae]KAE9100974.1 hypothetical protein PF010_g14604 [Phytophthora fragariae]
MKMLLRISCTCFAAAVFAHGFPRNYPSGMVPGILCKKVNFIQSTIHQSSELPPPPSVLFFRSPQQPPSPPRIHGKPSTAVAPKKRGSPRTTESNTCSYSLLSTPFTTSCRPQATSTSCYLRHM